MKILLFHPSLLPPRDYGGVERVVLWLARGLIERGHEVHIAAFQGSRPPPGVRLIEVDRRNPSALAFLSHFPRDLDVVHFMAPPEPGIWERLPWPGLVTVHGNGKPGEIFPKNTIFLSRDHAARHAAEAFVYNGIDPQECRFDPAGKTENYLFLSKTSWRVKNLRGAIRLCLKAKKPLWVAGGNRPFLLRARTWIEPSIRWVGPVADERKARLLSEAKAFLFPVIWPEPFGLVVAEALMSGTPVLASRKGSLPELVPPEVGALLPSPGGSGLQQEEQDALWLEWLERKQLPWNPEACREWALKRFHYRVMAESYEEYYLRVCRGDVIHPEHPKTKEGSMSP